VLLADRTLNDKQRGRLQRVQRAVQEAGELVTALLALAREQAGQAVAREPVPLADLLESLSDSHRYLLARKPVKVLLHVEAEAQVDCVPALLRAVLGNLLRNAFSYTREGEVRVVLRADSVSISDSGPGIDTALLPEVFERHARGPQGGEGIGLSLVQRICEREGWRVLMRSSGVGQGTLARVAFAADMTSASHGANESLTRC
jgi:signal transduction histidine kinase